MMSASSAFYEQELLAHLRKSADVAIALLALHSGSCDGRTTNPKRDFSDLIRHLAWIPKEQILLMRGEQKDVIQGQLGARTTTHAAFADALHISIDFFADALHGTDMSKLFTNARGYTQSQFNWCLEALAHFSHHRHQLYEHILSHGVVIPRDLLQRLFCGHLVLTMPYDGS